ncbi:MAG TPA: choice-of-anchor D domain-containing protein [Candidatus Kapabacteria bacterium]|nr:choice-of-anchor D domain-containing protein [Candidatus Kapabacteria bacterium]
MMSSLPARRHMWSLPCIPSVLVMILLGLGTANGQQLSSYYTFGSSLGTFTSLTGANTVILNSNGATGVGVYNEDATAGPFSIGFSFVFNGTAYSTFTLNARGFLILGTTLNSNPNNAIEAPPIPDPIIAAFWDQQHMYDGSATCIPPVASVNVSYVVTGVAPNRVLNVEWGTQLVSAATYYYAGNCLPMCDYEIRLYECSNRIEFQYGAFRVSTNTAVHSTASIGLASGLNNYVSVTPGLVNTASSVTPNNLVDNNNVAATTLIPIGQIFSFSHFTPDITGRTGVGNGGTATMTPGDTLLKGMSAIFGNPLVSTPFSLSVPASGCSAARKYGLVITGPAAADYYFGSPGIQISGGSVGAGSSVIPPITFAPTAVGNRYATLTVFDSTNNVSKSYVLAAKGTSRISFVGIIPQGGTAAMATGDTLLLNTFVVRGTSANFTPFTLTNVGTNGALPPASITYTITGGAGQYTINPPTSSLSNGQSATPTLTFNAVGVGPQPATLTINADGEIRTYVLYATAAVPSAIFRVAGVALDSSSTLFSNHFACEGEAYDTYQIQVLNNGGVPFTISKVEVFETDTVYKQGSPRYPLRHDKAGRLIPMQDYFLTVAPPVAPMKANAMLTYPYVIPTFPQASTMYITMISQRPGKRFGRIFVRTNCQNFAGPDTNGAIVTGLLKMDLFGRGSSSSLSDNPNGGLPQAIVFPVTPLGTSVEQTFQLYNTGTCDMRINPSRFELVAGDVDEFVISQMPSSPTTASNGDLIIPPGGNTPVKVTFTPKQVESRRASIRIMTNDSSIAIPGVTERGVYLLDLYGTGKSDLYIQGIDVGTALIGGNASEHTHGVVRVESSRNEPMIITKVALAGTDAADFGQDAAKPWPTRAYVIQGGQELDLGVEFAPRAGGQPGTRDAELRVYLVTGDSLVAKIHGIAGTREITVTPGTLNFGFLSMGKKTRRNLFVKNTGTMMLTVQQPDVQSPNGEFTATQLARTEFAPGQEEVIEVSFSQSVAGSVNGSITFNSNATNGAQVITLNGQSRTQKDDGGASSNTARTGGGQDIASSGLQEFSVSGVAGVRDASGLALMQSVPNPGRDKVEIVYDLPLNADATLELFDAQGRLVSVLDAGRRDAGEHRVLMDVSSLASGTYHYRLTAGGVLTRNLVVEH